MGERKRVTEALITMEKRKEYLLGYLHMFIDLCFYLDAILDEKCIRHSNFVAAEGNFF
jgi:hypothetical protein